MGKKELMMLKKLYLVVVLLAVVVMSGCETARGFGEGIGSVAYGVSQTAEGVGKDSYNLFNSLMAADNWIKENWW